MMLRSGTPATRYALVDESDLEMTPAAVSRSPRVKTKHEGSYWHEACAYCGDHTLIVIDIGHFCDTCGSTRGWK